MAVRYRPNQQLREALAEARWSGQRLAAAVNALGAENGLSLHYDRTTVAHWLNGTRPRPPAPDLIAEALTRRLGRPIGPAQLALTAIPTVPGAANARTGTGETPPPDQAQALHEGDLMAELIALNARQTGRRQVLAGATYSLAALTVPDWAHAALAGTENAARTSPERTGIAHAESAEAMAAVFASGDAAFGGGHGRRALAAYLSATIAPRLRGAMSPGVHRRMLSAAAQLAYLCAFMCFDDELHGFAQRYYRASLQLAADSGDQTMYAVTLRAMSVQALTLGHYRHAVQLAETASATRIAPARQAFILGQLAVADAATGNRDAALNSLAKAERHLDRTDGTAPVTGQAIVGAYHQASLAHQQAAVQSLLGDHRGAITALKASIRHRPPGEQRSRAITLARLAELQLTTGRLEEATATWNQFLDHYPGLRSRRAVTALGTLQARIRPYAGSPTARLLLERVAALRTRS
jgi:tetratricopeptide (TPR) repeat protein